MPRRQFHPRPGSAAMRPPSVAAPAAAPEMRYQPHGPACHRGGMALRPDAFGPIQAPRSRLDSRRTRLVKLYNSIGPNPRVVRMFLAEKGVELPLVPVDLMAAENRREPYLSKNPAGQLPCLELDDGSFLAE